MKDSQENNQVCLATFDGTFTRLGPWEPLSEAQRLADRADSLNRKYPALRHYVEFRVAEE